MFSDIITFWQVGNSEFICLFSKLMCYDLWYLFEFDLSSNCHVFTHAKLSQYNHARFAPFCISHQKEFSKCGNSYKVAKKIFVSSLIHIERSLIQLVSSLIQMEGYLILTSSTFPLWPLNIIHWNMTGSRISALQSLCFSGRSEKQDDRPGLSLADTFSTSPLWTLNRIQRNLTGSKVSTSVRVTLNNSKF